MPKFGRSSRAKLDKLDGRLACILERVIEYKDFTILETHRTQEKQDLMVIEGKSKLKWPHSKHNSDPSRAVDIAPWPIDWKDAKRFAHLAGLVQGIGLAMGIKLRWGGDWDRDGETSDNIFNDLPHLEIDE